MNINSILLELAADNSRIYKTELLQKHKGNEVLKRVIKLALDPFTQFYIRKIPKYTPNSDEGIALNFALDSLNDLSLRHVTGNAAIAHLTGMLEALNEDDAKVIERIIAKDLKCGVAASTANVVWTGLVNEYPCMLCSQFEEKLIAKIKFPASVQLKMDGMRFNAIVKDGKVEFRSRNGKEIQLLGNLEQEFLQLAGNSNCVFDGELVVNDKGVLLDRQTGNGILNKAVKGTISDLEAHKVHATIWDIIQYADFVAGKGNVRYDVRFAVLSEMKMPKKINLVEATMVNSFEEAEAIFEKYLSEGQEGIILKDSNSIWESKRSKGQIKFKAEETVELRCIGIKPGTGKYDGLIEDAKRYGYITGPIRGQKYIVPKYFVQIIFYFNCLALPSLGIKPA
jgi:ATP-dependent DNA ligase